ncbi:AraC family transcriptional regulator [Aquincola sp. S2]|uniref:AraC family transcriptional regulator n=1 Tax=Pseudaquabacterium terrae TaxID=2732868 RepID=A0ABX2EBM4_9BURK|nr:helix-turn-helix domain-containing protein [Aquabacterium terrae]NRF65757.1 AraC family transcriptional regulator [Aquabacterium terrae]
MPERLFVRLDGDPLYAPETDVPAGTMQGFAVAPPLREFVANITAYREQIPDGRAVEERVLPDGAVHLIFNLGDAPTIGGQAAFAAEAVGASAAPAVLHLQGRVAGLSLTLRPGAAAALLGVPASEIASTAVSLEALWRHDAGELLERLAAARDDAARVALLQEVLQRHLNPADRSVRQQAMQAARLLAESTGNEGLRDVTQSLGIGERRLQQIFQAHIGLTPRAWRRLARLHACLRALRQPVPPRWAEVAQDLGFYDQSHLVNEFQALCGLTPGLFFERVVAGSSKTSD